jgi:diguanylate cyclase (GGDEF)-like protein
MPICYVKGLYATAAGVATATAAAALVGNALLRRRLSQSRAELQAAERYAEHARYDAVHDKLTGLVNRAGLDGHLTVCALSDSPVWVLLVDLDGFKPVNDTYGHAAGDVVLVAVARRLRRYASSVAGRLGGDEFVLVAEAESEDEIADLAEDVIATLRRPIAVRSGVKIRVSASVGWVTMQPGDDPGDVLHTADTALYRAKAAGGNQAIAWSTREPLRTVEVPRPPARQRDAHPHRVPAELGVVVAR